MPNVDLWPDSRLRSGAGTRRMVVDGVVQEMAPLYCFNCGKGPGPYVTIGCRASWLCTGPDGCEHKPVALTAAGFKMPDELHFQLLLEEQLATKGRPWTEAELLAALDEPNSTMSKLSRDWLFSRGK